MKVAILSDIHANIYALQSVLAECRQLGAEQYIVAGDLVGYYYWSAEVVDTIRTLNCPCVLGNHELILQEFVQGRPGLDKLRKKYGSGYDRALSALSADALNWLLTLPREQEVVVDGLSIYISHGGLRSVDCYLYPTADKAVLDANYSDCDLTIFGHTHYPFVAHRDGKVMINPGSVGQPRDVGGAASYALLDTQTRLVQIKRRPYDTGPVVQAAQAFDPALPYLHEIMVRS